jgi:mitochondrial import receptor subunit TOM40
VSLKPELFEGLRFDFTRPLNQKFSLQHSLFMGSVEVRYLELLSCVTFV